MSTHNRYFLVAVLTLVGALLQATELSLGLNGSFEETVTSKDGTTTPKCWMFNSAFRKNGSWGTVAYAEGQHSLGITAQRGPVHVFTSVGFSAAPGQPFTITTDVRGKGAFKVWLYCYGDAGWVGGNVSSAEKQVDAEKWQSMVFQLAIPTTPFPKGEVRSIKLALDVAKGAALQFDNLTLVTETKMKPTQTNAGGEMLRLYLPPVIHAVPGIECNLYFDNTLLVVNPANYVFDVSCAKGTQQQERWTFMPSDADVGDCVFTLAVRDGANAVLAKAETLLRVVPGDSLQKLSILMVGDSLTHASMYPSHVAKLAAADKKMDLTLVGSHQPKKELPLARHEGYGGWTAKNFTTRFRADPEGYRASSPFLYEGADGKPVLDFPRYCRENNGDKIPDIVTIFLGPNDIFHADDETIDAVVQESLDSFDILIKMIRDASAETRIGLLLPAPAAATQDAFGINYGCLKTRWQYRRNLHRMIEDMLERYGDRESEKIFLVPIGTAVDPVAGFPAREELANSRTEIKITRMCNSVHPNESGYRQIGDTIYCWLKSLTKKQ